MSDTKEFIAKFHEAVYLDTRGIIPKRLDMRDDGKVLYVFNDTQEARNHIRDMKLNYMLQQFITSEIELRREERSFREANSHLITNKHL